MRETRPMLEFRLFLGILRIPCQLRSSVELQLGIDPHGLHTSAFPTFIINKKNKSGCNSHLSILVNTGLYSGDVLVFHRLSRGTAVHWAQHSDRSYRHLLSYRNGSRTRFLRRSFESKCHGSFYKNE
jgi:hypothetical protein